MKGFELWISCDGSSYSANCNAATALFYKSLFYLLFLAKSNLAVLLFKLLNEFKLRSLANDQLKTFLVRKEIKPVATSLKNIVQSCDGPTTRQRSALKVHKYIFEIRTKSLRTLVRIFNFALFISSCCCCSWCQQPQIIQPDQTRIISSIHRGLIKSWIRLWSS